MKKKVDYHLEVPQKPNRFYFKILYIIRTRITENNFIVLTPSVTIAVRNISSPLHPPVTI